MAFDIAKSLVEMVFGQVLQGIASQYVTCDIFWIVGIDRNAAEMAVLFLLVEIAQSHRFRSHGSNTVGCHHVISFHIVKLDDIWASFAIREDRLGKLRIGDKVEIEVPALNRKIPMIVANISAMGDFATWRATSDRDRFDLKSFEVKLRPESPVDGLRPGMTARW